MDVLEVMKTRHSVRSYNDRKIESAAANELRALISDCNQKGGLHIQLCLDEPNAFDSFLAHYGKFNNVKNYIALIGKKSEELDEKIGYYGEKIVLKATDLGLGSCWVAMTYSKSKNAALVEKGEKVVCVISLGYYDKESVSHKSKSIEELSDGLKDMPDWFRRGIEAVQLAPTAMNQQKFLFSLNGNTVTSNAGRGFYTKVDLGIAKYHFELGAGTDNFHWNNN